MSPYAIQQQLNAFLNAKLVREVQMTKTGFAICPVNIEAQEALSVRMDELESFLSSQGQCKVEKPIQHNAYRLSGVPRSYASYNGSSMEMTQISATTIAEALTDLTNVAPINVLESRGSSTSEFYHQKNWIVLYPKGSTLSKLLPLFG
ncbi:hypothetical protein K3495_g17416, partial [Podosphaera aphanis]